jgi:hypothetical protein
MALRGRIADTGKGTGGWGSVEHFLSVLLLSAYNYS